MPGIAGVISKDKRIDLQKQMNSMLPCLCYEPFYRSGTYFNESLGLAVGWTSHTGSFSDCMPVWNENRDVCLIFSGEDFSDPGDIQALRARGHVFETGKARYLIHLYEEAGSKFFEKLNGWFSGVLVDLRQQRAFLFNDRYGANRVFYHENEQGIFFSSEVRALLKVLPEIRRLDFKSLGEFFACGNVMQNRTLFSGVALLPAGSLWSIPPTGPILKGVYFHQETWEGLSQLDPASYYDRLKETWQRILPRYLGGEERVGLSLTGGVDSRMILAWTRSLPGALPCYTWGGSYRDCADVALSRHLAHICRQPHQTIPVAQEFLSRFPSLAEKAVCISGGGMDVTGSIDVYVLQQARQIAPARLCGVYGGEILRRLVMFKPGSLRPDVFVPEVASCVQDCARTFESELDGNRLSFTAFKQVPWHMAGKFAIEGSQVTYRTPYLDNELVALAYQSPPQSAADNDVSLRLIADGNSDLSTIATDRALSGQSLPMIGRLLHAYQEFTFKAEYAYDYGMPQWLAKVDHVFAPFHLERLFLGRHKFHHFRVWYRDQLASYVKEMLLDSRTLNRPYLRAKTVEDLVNGHVTGNRNHTLEIHKLLALELVQRQLIEAN
jgi:asparagine synthase (glutamine-hydrolysing)